MRYSHAVLALVGALAGCTSTPRPFVADFEPSQLDRPSLETVFRSCADEVAAGRTQDFQTGAVDPGPAVGAAAAAAGSVLVYAGAASGWSGLGTVGAGAGMVALSPVATAGVAGAIRSSREHAIQQAMSACLRQNDYTVVRWRPPTGSEIADGVPTTPTAPYIAQPVD